MSWSEIVLSSAVTTAALGVLAFLSREWVSARLREGIASDYAKALELYKQQIASEEERRRQAADLASLFALWLRQDYAPGQDVKLLRWKLQERYCSSRCGWTLRS